jgi:hypothetical protein
LINEVKERGTYETKRFDLYRNLNRRADGKRADAIQGDTEKVAEKDDGVSRQSGHGRRPASRPAAHVFTCAISPKGVFNRAAPRADVQGDAEATTRERFVNESATNDEYCASKTHACSFQQRLGRGEV